MVKRKDIQGLRALAVSLVVVFHVWPAALPGGFVGVDVFFVISGYLICGILLRELRETGSISLSAFWVRRIRRLLPAAFVTLLVSLLLVLAVFPPYVWRDHLAGIVASAFYVQNWQLVAAATDYAAAGGDVTIAQHFWSLAVEEQFYVFWPLLLIAMAAVVRVGRDRAVLALTLGIFATSLAYSIYESHQGKALAYFSTFTRAWEFAAGALILHLPALRAEHEQRRTALAWIGVAAILAGAIITSTRDPFPGYIALLPVLGTVCLIWAATDNTRSGLARVLSLRPVQWLGDASYSIYLWHWPLVIVIPMFVVGPVAYGTTTIALTLLLAGLSKRFVEDPPLRRDREKPVAPRTWYGFATLGMTMFVAIAVPIWQRPATEIRPVELGQYFENPRAAIEQTLLLEAWPEANEPPGRSALPPEWIEDRCLDVRDEATAARCTYGPQDASRTMIVIGDSWANHFLPALRSGFPDWRIRVLTLGQCPIARVDVRRFDRADVFDACTKHRESVLERLASEAPPDLIVAADSNSSTLVRLMSGRTGQAAYEELESGYRAVFSELARVQAPVVILESPPQANCVAHPRSSPRDCTPNHLTEFQRVLSQMKLELAAEAGLAPVDTVGFFCSKELVCPDVIGKTLVKADGAHISGQFSKAWGPVLAKVILRSAEDIARSRPAG